MSGPTEDDPTRPLPYAKRPCTACPWRIDARPGRFPAERWAALVATVDSGTGSAPLGAPFFACHTTPEGREQLCAGWLAQEGHGHVGIRVAVLQGRLPGEVLKPGEHWPALHATFGAAVTHDLGWPAPPDRRDD
jgi:hypothetical protein